MLSFKKIPLAHFTEKLNSTFTLLHNKKVAEPRPFTITDFKLCDGSKVLVYHAEIDAWIPENRNNLSGKLSGYLEHLFDDTRKVRRQFHENPREIRARANMSHLTYRQQERLAQAKRNTRRNNCGRRNICR